MNNKYNLIVSGIPIVDKLWGGLYKGKNYLLIGESRIGKSSVASRFISVGLKNKENCLYLSNMKLKEFKNVKAFNNFDIQSFIENDLLTFKRILLPNDIFDFIDKDEFLTAYFEDIKNIVKEYSPKRIVIDELTPFIEFESLTTLLKVYNEIIEFFQKENITSLFILREPATKLSKILVNSLMISSMGMISLHKNKFDKNNSKITLTSNYLSSERDIDTNDKIEFSRRLQRNNLGNSYSQDLKKLYEHSNGIFNIEDELFKYLN